MKLIALLLLVSSISIAETPTPTPPPAVYFATFTCDIKVANDPVEVNNCTIVSRMGEGLLQKTYVATGSDLTALNALLVKVYAQAKSDWGVQ